MSAPCRSRPARQRLVSTASRLFYARGKTATGFDSITAEAGVAKMTLYNNFSSKQDLMLVYLDDRHQELLEFYHQRLAQSKDATQRVLAMSDAYIDHASMDYGGGFRGCGLLNAGHNEPAATATQMAMLLEGAMTRAGFEGSTTYLQQARQIAQRWVATL